MSKWLVIAEKPSVALDYAKSMGPYETHDSGAFYETSDYVISFAVGHLLELAEPESYNAEWKRWSLRHLPMLPEEFKYKPRDKKAQTRLKLLKKLAKRKDVIGVVNGCDAGREGEHIFRTIFPNLGRDLPVLRLWLNSMTKRAIKEAFKGLRPGADYDGLGHAAACRAEADWLIGMNATRALTRRLKSFNYAGAWSVGRVQTPTLAMVADREAEILAHRPKAYWEIKGHFDASDHRYEGLLRLESPEDESKPTRIFDPKHLSQLESRLSPGTSSHSKETRKESRERAPLPYDLTTLQKTTGMTAKTTQDIAQALYERHKLTSYPRTDSRHLPQDHLPLLDAKLSMLAQHPLFSASVATIQRDGALNIERIYDDTKLSDHHAIVPVGTPSMDQLSDHEKRVYTMIVRQYLASMMSPAIWETVERSTTVEGAEGVAFFSRGRMLLECGWQAAMGKEVGHGSTLKPLSEPQGQAVSLISTESMENETKPKARFTDATLVSRMENCGKEISDEALSKVLKGRGLGTPATRADTIERLIGRGYLVRVQSGVRATAKALRLIEVLKRSGTLRLTSAELTGDMEKKLRSVESLDLTRTTYMEEVRTNTVNMVESLVGFDFEEIYQSEDPVGSIPGMPAVKVMETAWGYASPEGSDEVFFVWKDIGGRIVSPDEMRGLLEASDHRMGPVTLFPRASGRSPGYKAFLQLERLEDEAYEKLSPTKSNRKPSRWRVKIEPIDGGHMERDESEQVVGPFVKLSDGLEIIETSLRYADTEFINGAQKPKALLPKLVCERQITEEEARAYFLEGQTELLGGFKSKKGRFFKAKLILKPNGRHGFEFAPRGAKES